MHVQSVHAYTYKHPFLQPISLRQSYNLVRNKVDLEFTYIPLPPTDNSAQHFEDCLFIPDANLPIIFLVVTAGCRNIQQEHLRTCLSVRFFMYVILVMMTRS